MKQKVLIWLHRILGVPWVKLPEKNTIPGVILLTATKALTIRVQNDPVPVSLWPGDSIQLSIDEDVERTVIEINLQKVEVNAIDDDWPEEFPL